VVARFDTAWKGIKLEALNIVDKPVHDGIVVPENATLPQKPGTRQQ